MDGETASPCRARCRDPWRIDIVTFRSLPEIQKGARRDLTPDPRVTDTIQAQSRTPPKTAAPATRAWSSPPSVKTASTTSPANSTAAAIPARSSASRPGMPSTTKSLSPPAAKYSSPRLRRVMRRAKHPAGGDRNPRLRLSRRNPLRLGKRRRRLQHVHLSMFSTGPSPSSTTIASPMSKPSPTSSEEAAMAHPYHHCLSSMRKRAEQRPIR